MASFRPATARPLPARRRQAQPIAFMLGTFLFLLIFAYFMILWQNFLESYDSHVSRADSSLSAIVIADQLASHTGSPEGWTESPENASSIGLASSQGKLDSHKLAAFSTMPYAFLKRALGTDKNFIVKVESGTGELYALAGQQPANTTRAVEVTRAAMLNNTVVFVRVQVYE